MKKTFKRSQFVQETCFDRYRHFDPSWYRKYIAILYCCSFADGAPPVPSHS